MITGALMLAPDRQMSLDKLLKKYILKYALVILVFCWFFALLEELFNTKEITLTMFGTSFLAMLQGQSWAHMWYMYTLLGIMFVVPILRIITKYAGKKTINFICLVGTIFLSVIPLFNIYTGFKLGVEFPISMIYPLYMLIGYWIDKGELNINNKISYWLMVTSVVGLIGLSILNQYVKFAINYAAYDSPVIMLLSIALFSAFKNIKFQENKKIDFIDKTTFGVYIIHMLWINILYKFMKINPFDIINPFIGFAITFVSVSCLSIVTSYILKKIPLVRKLV